MHYVYWVTEATVTHRDYVIFFFYFPRQQLLSERASVIYVQCMSFSVTCQLSSWYAI